MFNTLVGAAVGAGLMYAMDPSSGARRRALLRDQFLSTREQLLHARAATVRDVQNRAGGMWAELRGSLTQEPVTDEVVEQRIRAGLGSRVRYPRHIHAEARDGAVALSGDVPADEVERLVRYVRGVRGVRHVDNRLAVHDDPAAMPGVQPPIPPRPLGPRLDILQPTWSPTTRLLVGAGGVSLMAIGCRAGAGIGMAMIAMGTLGLLRAVTNERLFGDARSRNGGQPGHGPASHVSGRLDVPAEPGW